MKIVGGKIIPGSQGQIGAYVAAIYPGGVADQLHGELQEGRFSLTASLKSVFTSVIVSLLRISIPQIINS